MFTFRTDESVSISTIPDAEQKPALIKPSWTHHSFNKADVALVPPKLQHLAAALSFEVNGSGQRLT